MPSHPDRVRKNYSKCFDTGHSWLTMGNSDIAPFIGPTGLRVTWRICSDCGEKQSHTRTQEQFMKELELLDMHSQIYKYNLMSK